MLKQLFVTNLDYFLDRAMQLDKKHMPEYVGTMEATIEIQSLQIIGFLSMVRNQPALGCRIMQWYFTELHTLNQADKLFLSLT